MSLFEIVSSMTFGLCLLFFIIAGFEHLKPGMDFTKNVYVIWFYSLFITFGYTAYKVALIGGI
jgi:hypothetical protein